MSKESSCLYLNLRHLYSFQVQVGQNGDIFLAHFWVHFPSFQQSDRLLNTECDQENLNIAQQYYMHKMQGRRSQTHANSTRQTITTGKRALDKN